MPRKPLTQTDINSFRDAYCETAYALYERDDYDAVSMRAIAKEMGCSPMMAYRYFDNKEEVFSILRARLFDRLANTLEARQVKKGPLKNLEALGYAYVNFAHEEPLAYRLLYMIHMHQQKRHPECERAQKRTRKILFQATRAAVEAGDLKGDAGILAHTLWAGIHGLVSLNLAGQLSQGLNFDDLYPAMLKTMIAASR